MNWVYLLIICVLNIPWKVEGAKKYQLSICAIFKNEARYLKEWIEYHRLVGVDHFYLYNNNSKDNYFAILEPYIKTNLVTLVQWTDHLGVLKEDDIYLWSLSTQVPAYENAINWKGGLETKWMVFIDVNEFLVPPNSENLCDILNKYDEYPGVTLASDFYDAYRAHIFPKKKLLIETTELISPPYQNPDKGVSKTIFKPDLCKGFTWPPYTCVFKDQQESVKIRKPEMRINHYANKNAGLFYFGKTRLNIDNRSLSDEELSELLNEGYEIDDQAPPIARFVPDLLKRMGLN